MKKYRLGIMGAAKFAFGTSLLGYFLSLFFFAMGCENAKVAGITVSYTGYVLEGKLEFRITFYDIFQRVRRVWCCLPLSLFSYSMHGNGFGFMFDQFFM